MFSPNNQANLNNQQGRPSTNSFLVRITGGRNTAVGYPIALGYEVFLLDEENKMFFIKTNDPMGTGIRLREFSFEEVTPEPEHSTNAEAPNGFDPSKYATKEDLNMILEEIKKLQGGNKGRQYNGRNNRRSRNGRSYDESV